MPGRINTTTVLDDPLERCQTCRGYLAVESRCKGPHLTYYQSLRLKLQRTGDPWDRLGWLAALERERREARTG